MQPIDDPSCDFTSRSQRERRNQRRVGLWAVPWALSFLAVAYGATHRGWPFGAVLAGVIFNCLCGIGTVLAHRRFLRETDELRRKIEVEALALAFGIGVVGGLAVWLLEVSGAVSEAGSVLVFAAMLLTYSAGVWIGRRRYS